MRVLLTGARAPATLELARFCARSGHEVHVADTDRWHICRGSRLIVGVHRLPAPRRVGPETYAAALNRPIAAARIDTIVPTCEEIFHVAAIRDRLNARAVCESQSVLASLHDKAAFPLATVAAGLLAPRTFPLRTSRGADVNDLPLGQYVIKRRYSRFATDVRLWRPGDPPPLNDDESPGAWIARERLEGSALCIWSVAHAGQLRAHVTYAVDATAGAHGPAVAARLLESAWADDTAVLEPPAGRRFRSRLALLTYGTPAAHGAGLLDAADDPRPRRLQALTWLQLLLRAAFSRTDPRALSTADIEWNGE